MISLREVEDTIRSLENGAATYNNCMKLASLYIVRDELKKKEGQYGYYTYGYRGGYPMMYERGGNSGNSSNSGNSGQSSSGSYAYREPMMYNHDDDLMMRGEDMYNRRG